MAHYQARASVWVGLRASSSGSYGPLGFEGELGRVEEDLAQVCFSFSFFIPFYFYLNFKSTQV
jgi:hypothetical protein